MIMNDARDYQILFLSMFLGLGIVTRDWSWRTDLMLVLIVGCLFSQAVLSLIVHNRLSHSWRSALITSLGLCLLLRGDDYRTMAIAACAAIASKFLFRVDNKHFFNPANFGIIAALTVTNDAWVSPGQWGSDWWYLALFLGAGGLILQKVGRWDTSVAFLLSYTFITAIYNVWLGWGWDVIGHQLMSGSLLIFALFMITDPRSIPNSVYSRLIWAVCLALVSFGFKEFLFINNAMFWALFLLSPLTVFLDRVWLAPRFSWDSMGVGGAKAQLRTYFKVLIVVLVSVGWGVQPAWAFCGFYVAKADSSLYNQASQVVIARDGDRTILTMSNDYQGDVEDFALVVPVPVILDEDQVNIGNSTIVDRLDAFSAPRLVEYHDSDPCQRYTQDLLMAPLSGAELSSGSGGTGRRRNLGVTVESSFSVAEYDILILSATESDGLETWLNQNGYKIPKGAREVLGAYIRQNMKFFVAKVNLDEFDKTGYQKLRPLMMAYESSRFMLPIRLGMVNAKGEQDLLVYLLSPRGQMEVTNYRTVKVPSVVDVPEFVEQEFTDFYKDMFTTAYQRENKEVAFLEYSWNMANCDPCSAPILNPEELRQAGVFWLDDYGNRNVFITRIHVRYTQDKFPEDLRFQNTGNQQEFQGRYIINHPFRGEVSCDAGEEYKQEVRQRQEKEAQTLANLTGWDINDIRAKVDFVEAKPLPWWRRVW